MITFIGDNILTPGGIQVLIVNLISEFSKRGLITKLYCSKKSYVYIKLKENNVKYELIDADEIKFNQLDDHIFSTDTLVVSSFIKEIFFFKKSNPKFIYWVFIPNFEQYSLFTMFQGKIKLKLFRKSTKKIISELISLNSLYFQDGSTLKDVERIYNKIEGPKYIPIPININEQNLYLSKKNNEKKEVFTITYIGRGNVIWKVYPVVRLVEDLSRLNFNIKFHINIITDTDVKYKEFLSPIISDKLSVTYTTNLDHHEINKHLLLNSDLHVSMGTAALEGAKLGIPTILIDTSNFPFPSDYKYRWLFESNNDFSVGYWIEKDSDYKIRGVTLTRLLEKYIADPEYRKCISVSCYEYVNRSHDILKVADILYLACESTRAYVSIFKNQNIMIKFVKMKLQMRQYLSILTK